MPSFPLLVRHKRRLLSANIFRDFLVERRYIRPMYDSFVELFPFVHSVLAMTVSSPCPCKNQVGLSSFFNTGKAADLDEGNADDVSDTELTEDNLTAKQCAELDFLLLNFDLGAKSS